jgi:hypothetical protein
VQDGNVPTIRVKGKIHGKVTESELPADWVEGPAIRQQDTTILLHSGKNDFSGVSIAQGDAEYTDKTRCCDGKAEISHSILFHVTFHFELLVLIFEVIEVFGPHL